MIAKLLLVSVIILEIFVLGLIYCFYILWRNERTCKFRIFMIETNWNLYKSCVYNSNQFNRKHAEIDDKAEYDKVLYNPFFIMNPRKFFTDEELDKAWAGKYKSGICTKGFVPLIHR